MSGRHRVLLVRPWDTAGPGAGCCSGGTGGICVERGPGDGVPEGHALVRRQTDQRRLGDVYLTLRGNLPPEVAVEIVDPRNTLFLLPAMLRDGRRHGRPWPALLRDLVRAPGYAAIIVNGRVVSDAALPDPGHALRLVRQAIHRPRTLVPD